MLAGTQLSSLGHLTWSHDEGRLIAAGIGIALALGAVAGVISHALEILKPVEMSLVDVEADTKLKDYIEARPSTLGGPQTIALARSMADSPLLSDDERQAWSEILDDVVELAASKKCRRNLPLIMERHAPRRSCWCRRHRALLVGRESASGDARAATDSAATCSRQRSSHGRRSGSAPGPARQEMQYGQATRAYGWRR